MYAVISTPLDRRTRATLRMAEFGFFGVFVYTRVHTPRRCGEPFRAGVLVFENLVLRPCRTSCWIVGTRLPLRTEVEISRAEAPTQDPAMLEAAGERGNTRVPRFRKPPP